MPIPTCSVGRALDLLTPSDRDLFALRGASRTPDTTRQLAHALTVASGNPIRMFAVQRHLRRDCTCLPVPA